MSLKYLITIDNIGDFGQLTLIKIIKFTLVNEEKYIRDVREKC